MVEDFDRDDIEGEIHVGLDFGYVNDPTAVVYSIMDKKHKRIYIYAEEGGKEWTNDKIYEIMKISMYTNANPNSIIYADAAEPKSIKYLQAKGLLIKPAKKGKDSILKGIDYLSQFKIIIHSNCSEIIDELNQYTWIEKDGEPINTPINKFNHWIDALRYSYSVEASGSSKLSFSRMK